jgi:hypothetical protein
MDWCEDAVCVAGTTTAPPATDLSAFLAGFVCAEGSFIIGANRFAFSIGLGEADAASCDLAKSFFGVGHVRHHARRKDHYDDEVVYSVRALRDLVEVIVPFMDEHLTPSFKREQFETWRSALLEYWEHKAKRKRTCTIEGCDALARAKGRCRRHYYEAFGS